MLWLVRLSGDLAVEHHRIVLVNGTILMAVEFQQREMGKVSIATEVMRDWYYCIDVVIFLILANSVVYSQTPVMQIKYYALDCCK